MSNLLKYSCGDSMWVAMLKSCLDVGFPLDSREGGCREVAGWAGTLEHPDRALPLNPIRRISAPYSGAEVLWYLSLTGDIDMIRRYAPSYPQWADEIDGREVMYGAVGERLRTPGGPEGPLNPFGQLGDAVRLLQERPNTRRCVVALWRASDLRHAVAGDRKNLPCYCTLQYVLREGRLFAFTYMRSNDAWLGAPYDVFAFCALQKWMADRLDAEPGPYSHFVGSLHLYDKHEGRARRALSEWKGDRAARAGALKHGWEAPGVDPESRWVELERRARTGDPAEVAKEAESLALEDCKRTMIRDCALASVHHLLPEFDAIPHVKSPRFKELLRQGAAR